nr:uncharacterized mitochondrial protein AtMg00810-like [Ipomoea batatas]
MKERVSCRFANSRSRYKKSKLKLKLNPRCDRLMHLRPLDKYQEQASIRGNPSQTREGNRDKGKQPVTKSEEAKWNGKNVINMIVGGPEVGNALISWKSKKQPIVTKSSSEAEYKALAATTCEIQWLSFLLADLGVNKYEAASIYCDSKSAIAIAENLVFHERTKHIELDCHLGTVWKVGK